MADEQRPTPEHELFQLGLEAIEMRKSRKIEIVEVTRGILALMREDEKFWSDQVLQGATERPTDDQFLTIAAYILLP